MSIDMSTNHQMMAVDPGGSIGIAVRIPKDDGTGTYLTATYTDPKDVWNILSMYPPVYLAYEKFATGGRVDKNMLHTVEIVGGLRSLCHVMNIEMHVHQPQERRSFLPEAKILLSGRHATIHEHDALAHLLLLEYRLGQRK